MTNKNIRFKSNKFIKKIKATKNRLFIIAIAFLTNQFVSAQNYSLDFDGGDDLVTSPVMPDFLNTIEFWVKSDVGTDGVEQLSLPFNFSTAVEYISLNNCCSSLSGETITIVNDVTSPSATNQSLTPGWHHIAITSNGTNYDKIYIDGISANMISTNSPVIFNTKLDLGYRTSANPYGQFPYNGHFDEIRIWKVTKTQIEIQNNMNNELTGNEPGLILYYKMDNINSSCDIEDCSPNGYHGIRTGINNTNNLPQFSADAPTLTIVPCGVPINCSNLSIDNLANQDEFQIQIFPNPTNGEVTILFNPHINNANVSILNIMGQKIYEKVNVSNNQLYIEIPNQADGMYLIEIEDKGNLMRTKLIKNSVTE